MKGIKEIIFTIIFTIIFFVSLQTISQEAIFENFTENNGLPSTQVYDMYQDKNGYMWFATDRGIARYDGYSFESFGIKDGTTGNTVFKFYPQKNGDIWCSTFNNRLFYFNTSDYRFKPYEHNDTLVKYAVDAVINDLYLDSQKTLYLSYIVPFGLLKIEKSGRLTQDKEMIYPGSVVMERTKDGDEFTYYANENKLPRTNKGSVLTNQPITGSAYKAIQMGNLTVICDIKEVFLKRGDKLIKSIDTGFSPLNIGKYDKDHFWVAYRHGGVGIFDFKGNLIQSFLNGESVTFLTVDHESGIWISTLSSGVFYSKHPQIVTYDFGDDNYVYDLAQDAQNQLWVSLYDGNNYCYQNFNFLLRYTSNSNNPIAMDYNNAQNSHLLYCNGQLYLDGVSRLHLNNNYSSLTQYNNTLLLNSIGEWTTVRNSSVVTYKTKQRVKDIVPAKNGFYLATQRGLFFYDTLSRKESRISSAKLDCRIEDIEKVNGTFYFATLGSGVVIMKDKVITTISKANGLFSDQINKLYVENDSCLWVCTNMGLNRIQFHSKNGTYSISGLSTNDGLIYNNVTDVQLIGDVVWVGTRGGLCSFQRQILDQKRNHKRIDYHLDFLRFEMNGAEVSRDHLVELSHDENKLTFYFKAISFKNKSNLVYRYKMGSLERQWNYTSEPSCTYPSLPFGNYQFILQVSPDGKTWSNDKLVQLIHISPPFYSTWWFTVLIILSLSSAIYLFFKLRVLVYNKDVTRELIRLIIQKLKRKEQFILFRELGNDVKIKSSDVLYIKSSNNYIEIFTEGKTHIVRFKIGEFLAATPDPLEYLRIHRSFIIRIDKVNTKSVKNVQINGVEIPVGRSYQDELDKIIF